MKILIQIHLCCKLYFYLLYILALNNIQPIFFCIYLLNLHLHRFQILPSKISKVYLILFLKYSKLLEMGTLTFKHHYQYSDFLYKLMFILKLINLHLKTTLLNIFFILLFDSSFHSIFTLFNCLLFFYHIYHQILEVMDM